jgi:hypothetical protein
MTRKFDSVGPNTSLVSIERLAAVSRHMQLKLGNVLIACLSLWHFPKTDGKASLSKGMRTSILLGCS